MILISLRNNMIVPKNSLFALVGIKNCPPPSSLGWLQLSNSKPKLKLMLDQAVYNFKTASENLNNLKFLTKRTCGTVTNAKSMFKLLNLSKFTKFQKL